MIGFALSIIACIMPLPNTLSGSVHGVWLEDLALLGGAGPLPAQSPESAPVVQIRVEKTFQEELPGAGEGESPWD